MTLLSKSLQMLPEKFHGLTDTDTRYRQRYVDLIMNSDTKDTFIKRAKILSAVRKYLSGKGFALPSEIYRSDHESGEQGSICKALQDFKGDP